MLDRFLYSPLKTGTILSSGEFFGQYLVNLFTRRTRFILREWNDWINHFRDLYQERCHIESVGLQAHSTLIIMPDLIRRVQNLLRGNFIEKSSKDWRNPYFFKKNPLKKYLRSPSQGSFAGCISFENFRKTNVGIIYTKFYNWAADIK